MFEMPKSESGRGSEVPLRLTGGADVLLRCAAILQDERRSTGRGTGPLRKSIPSMAGWSDEALATIDKLEAVDPGPKRAAIRERLRDESAQFRAVRAAEEAGTVVRLRPRPPESRLDEERRRVHSALASPRVQKLIADLLGDAPPRWRNLAATTALAGAGTARRRPLSRKLSGICSRAMRGKILGRREALTYGRSPHPWSLGLC